MYHFHRALSAPLVTQRLVHLRHSPHLRACSTMATASSTVPLATPTQVGSLPLQHRVVMSPMTRLRCDPVTEAPNALVVEYYQQRASPGGLLLTECAAISPAAKGYIRAPNVYDAANLEGWKNVVAAVHEKGGYILAQIFHAGRVSHPSLLPEGQAVVAPSAVAAAGQVHIKGGKAPYPVPKELTKEEIKVIVQDFAEAAKNAVAAGFDGIEVHAGNGYLVQEFMALKTNQRTDEYGGSVENRMRFLLEVLDACSAAIGADKVAVKLQPGVTFSDLIEPAEDVKAQLEYLAQPLSSRGLAYVCLSTLNGEPYFRFVGLSEPNITFDLFKVFRDAGFAGTPLMVNGGFTVESGNEAVSSGVADLVSYGVPFIANPTLPALIAAGWGQDKLNPGGFDTKVWYSKDPAQDAAGFTDWPSVTP